MELEKTKSASCEQVSQQIRHLQILEKVDRACSHDHLSHQTEQRSLTDGRKHKVSGHKCQSGKEKS